MKKMKRRIIVIILIILILVIFLFQIKNIQNNRFQDELIFFKLFPSSQEMSKNTPHNTYEFKVSYRNIDFKKIYLGDTINPNTLVSEKIAPRNERKI